MLSVVIPTLNEEAYLPKLLSCLYNQSFKDFEVITVDGNSLDKTREAAEKYKSKLNLKFFKARLRNVSFQRNFGLSKAKYERVLFLDADTSFDNKFLENALNEINRKQFSLCGCLLYPDSNHALDRLFFLFFRIYILLFHRYAGLNGACIFTTKNLHKKAGGFDESIKVGEDFDYAQRLKKFTRINILKSTSIKTSVRRFEKNGRIITGVKILLIGLYTFFIGKVTTNIFNYRFNEKIRKV